MYHIENGPKDDKNDQCAAAQTGRRNIEQGCFCWIGIATGPFSPSLEPAEPGMPEGPSVCVFVYFYQFLKLLGLRACQYNISIMIRIKPELN